MRALRILTVAMVVACGCSQRACAQSTNLLNGIEAVVHDSVITIDEVATLNDETVDVVRRQFGDNPALYQQKVADMQRDNLETLVDRQLVLHEFKTAGYSLPESVLDEIVESEIRSRFAPA